MPFHQHVNNALIWGGVVVSWVYTVRLVKGYTGASPPLTLSLFFLFSLLSNPHTPGVDTSNKSSTKKMVWEQNPNYNVFQSLPPKQENNRTNEGNMIHTHHLSREEKNTHNKGGGSVPHFLDKDMYRLNK